ncbi:MAG: dihydroxy-acid dehydratase, partial [Rhodospirillaceae bacterium]|nr:dihydroxy-acid dehydratase [Rhodospirillaceae bacterium]
RLRAGEATGAQALETARLGLTPSKLITENSVENALRVLLALGGSTNGILHLTAIAGRRGIPISLRRLNELSDTTPVLVNLKPTGVGYMEDFHAAGAMGTLLRDLAPLLHMDCLSVTGESLGDRLKAAPGHVDRTIIRSREEPFEAVGGLVALYGNLAPDGAILKRSAADPAMFEHTGRAVVFSSLEDLADRIDSDDLDVKADDILVLQNAGPKSPSGMPEAGYIPIPKKLAQAGVKDMVRISDCRMSGTAFGTIVLHVTPEAAIGGAIGLVENGDEISLSISNKSLELHVNNDELERRRQASVSQQARPSRGYAKLYADHVTQADQGADFDFLMATD